MLNAVRPLEEAAALDVAGSKDRKEELNSRRGGDWIAFLQHAGHAC